MVITATVEVMMMVGGVSNSDFKTLTEVDLVSGNNSSSRGDDNGVGGVCDSDFMAV